MRFLALLILLAGCAEPDPDFGRDDDDDDSTPTDGCDFRGTPQLELSLADTAADLGLQDLQGVNNGMAAEDFDGDGDIDVLNANPGPRHEMYLQQDDGTFERHPTGPSLNNAPAASAVDYDGDGDVDVYLHCGTWESSCPSRLYRNEGNDGDGRPIFADVTDEVGLFDPTVSNFGGAWADYDLDGDLDLFQGCKDLMAAPDVPSTDQLWRNDDGVFVEVAVASGLGSQGDSHQAAWLDYDGDGYPDLYVPVLTGPNLLYRNLGDGSFEDVTTPALAEPYVAFAAVVADFNQDGVDDLLVSGRSTSFNTEEHGLYISDGEGGLEDWSLSTGLNDEGDSATGIGTMGLQVGDLDLDGFPEVAFGTGDPSAGERNALGSFVPDGDGLLWVDRTEHIDSVGQAGGNGNPPYPFRTHGMVMADIDGDFDVDLYMGNGGGPTAEPNQFWENQSAVRNHALRVELQASSDNRRGIGARVRVSDGPEGASTWASYRSVQATSGFNSSRPATMTIGLGQCAGPYHVTVSWPGGDVQELDSVDEDGTTLVIHQD